MRELPWRILAAVVSWPPIARWLIRRSKATPYSDITSRDGKTLYMRRHWLFNPYSKDEHGNETAKWRWLPSVRVHQIMRPDDDEHMHSHPWNARTIVLRGYYVEERPAGSKYVPWRTAMALYGKGDVRVLHERRRGYTGRVLFDSYHRIVDLPASGGVHTLWFTWGQQGTWGFLVDGQQIKFDAYLKGRQS